MLNDIVQMNLMAVCRCCWLLLGITGYRWVSLNIAALEVAHIVLRHVNIITGDARGRRSPAERLAYAALG